MLTRFRSSAAAIGVDAWRLCIAVALSSFPIGYLSGVLASSSFNALLAEKSADENRTLVFSLGSIAWTAAMMIGSLISGLPEWLQASGWPVLDSYHPLFWLSLVSTLLSVLLLLPLH